MILFLSKKSEKIKFLKEKIIQQPVNYYLLIGLLLIGFFFRLDYSNRFGCIIFEEPIFELKNILFSTISITLVLLSFFFKKRMIKLAFISLELLFWIAKLFLFKGGYVVSIMAAADPLISFYDTATLALRFFTVISLLKININQIFVLICTIIVMCIKIHIFPLPHSFYVQVRKSELESENTKNFLTKGEWIENKDITEKIQIVFYQDSAIIYNLQNNDSLFFNLGYFIKGHVFLEDWAESNSNGACSFDFQEKGKDTIDVIFWYNNEEYKTQMIRKF